MRIILVRHAQSEGNIDESAYIQKGDVSVGITEAGQTQALTAGKFLARYYRETNTQTWPEIFISPYLRTQQTLRAIYEGIKSNFDGDPVLKADPHLTEKFFGATNLYDTGHRKVDPEVLGALQTIGKAIQHKDPFLTRNLLGDSNIDVMIRIKSFLNGTFQRDRNEGKDDFLIVTHGAVIQLFAMCWAHLDIRDKSIIQNPHNCDVIVIEGTQKNWHITKVYDGESFTPVNQNYIEGLRPLSIKTLAPLPFTND